MKQHLNTFLIAFAIILSAYFLGTAFKNRNKTQESIKVTGLGETDFTSNLIVWNGSFSKKNSVLKDAYTELDSDREKIKDYLISKGIKAEEMVFSSISIDKEFDRSYDNYGNLTYSSFTGYKLTQSINIESSAVDKVENISRQVSELIQSGVEFYSESPQYYYTKLAELKVEMIAKATKDANNRALKIAENSDSKLGKLKNASMGVFKLLPKILLKNIHGVGLLIPLQKKNCNDYCKLRIRDELVVFLRSHLREE